MVNITIDMTNRNKRYRSGVGLCRYCNNFACPNGKIINFDTDKLARRTDKGDWKCGTCVIEDMKKATGLMNRGKDLK